MTQFRVRIAGDDLVFSAAHFIVFADGTCERLHGHSHRVAAELAGPLDENQCVVDFLAVRAALKTIVGQLDHRTLLPADNPAIQLRRGPGEIEVRLADRRWVFPADDCLLLPIANTTAELLAEYVGGRLIEAIERQYGAAPSWTRIEISEGTGCQAAAEIGSP